MTEPNPHAVDPIDEGRHVPSDEPLWNESHYLDFVSQDGSVADGQRTARTWLVHCLRVTKGQAGQHRAIQALASKHAPLLAGLRDHVVTRSVALELTKWTRRIPEEFRPEAEEILMAAARAGADLRALAEICAEIQARTAPPDPDDPDDDPRLDCALSLDTTLDGAGVLRGDLTSECAAMVTAVLDALSAPVGGGDLRTRARTVSRCAGRGDAPAAGR